MNRVISKLQRPALDLTYRQFHVERRRVHMIGTWLRYKNHTQPCLALLNANHDLIPGRTIPCVIALDQAWRWAMHGDSGDPAHCGMLIYAWMRDGALPGNHEHAHERLAHWSMINDYLPDLIAMPPAPPKEQRVIGEAITRNAETGEIIKETEVKQDV